MKAGSKTKLITGYKATTANGHDINVTGTLLERKKDAGQPVHADSAYRSEAIEKLCRSKKIESCIH